MTVRDSITRARARTPGAEDYPTSKAAHDRMLNPTQCGIIEFTTMCAKDRHKPNTSRRMPGAGLNQWCAGRCCPTCRPSSRIGENPPYGMIGRVEETSASFEARSAPRLYPTIGARPVGIHRFQSASGASIQQDLTLSAFTAATITSTGRLSTLMADQCLSPASSNKNPDHAGIFCPRFRSMHHQIGRPMRPQNLHVPLAEVIEVIVRSYRLDSEQFRSAPRTCWPLCGRLSVR